MTLNVFIALTGFCLAASITPGPNNLMVFASGANFGVARTVPHILGIAFGVCALFTTVGMGVGQLLQRAPALFIALKVIGALYMLYLAWRIANAGKIEQAETAGRPMNFIEAALFQWLNPKAWVISIVALSTYTTPGNYYANLVIVNTIFALIVFPVSFSWAGFGSVIARLLSNSVTRRRFNIAMALALVASLWPMLR